MNQLRRRIQTAAMSGGEAAPPPFSPLDIADLKLWLDATVTSSVTVATGASQINDLSGNGNHATQFTSSKQPLYTAGQYITFDGVDDFMAIPALGAIGTASRSYVCKIYFTAAQIGALLSHFGVVGYDFFSLVFYIVDATLSAPGKRISALDQGFPGQESRLPVTTSNQDGATVSVVLVRTSTSDKIYVNGALNASLSGAVINNDTNFNTFIGGVGNGNGNPTGTFYNGRILKILIYANELSTDDVLNLYNAGY